MESRIDSVAVVGGGIVGWSAAAALKRRLPYLTVTLVDAESSKEDLANRLASTLPSITGFHADIGLTEADTVARAASAFRLGTRFFSWGGRESVYVHAYAAHGKPLDSIPFHQLWLKARWEGGAEPWHHYSLQAVLGEEGRIISPAAHADAGLQYGLTIDPDLYGGMMRAYAEHLGVRSSPAPFGAVALRSDDGFVERLDLADGSSVAANLFVDATGPAAALRSRLDDDVQDWSKWLPCDRVLVATAPADPVPSTLDPLEAVEGGWRWRSSGVRSAQSGICFSSAYLGEEQARQYLPADCGPSALRQLRQQSRAQPWLKNVVAVGAAATSVEPLEWTNLHLVHSALDRIVAMMPGRDCAPVELSEYNRQSADEAARIRDFLCMHYICSQGPGAFWEQAASIEPPPSLAHTLALFRERGRLPFYEEETFARDSWLAVLLGQGVIPRRVDPLADRASADLRGKLLSHVRQMIAKAVATSPSQADFLRSLFRQIER